ncbi:hypothetical protein CL617_04585 [archaeon]|nr:hypothetical protein [archaeon]|tara:strand:- start:8848 stop:9285 length:438 start_codon:yes stop_codon:yes gene_type:complete
MKPKFLYHGSNALIKEKFLKENTPTDKTSIHNYFFGVYATDNKDIAKGMALAGFRFTKSFGDYSKKPFKIIFVRGKPKGRFVYVYKVSSSSFIENPKRSHQWISRKNVKIINVEKFSVDSLKEFWRGATAKEKLWYYKQKSKSSR